MAPEWELALGMELGMGLSSSTSSSVVSNNHAHGAGGFAGAGGMPRTHYAPPEPLRVDDLLDLSHAAPHDSSSYPPPPSSAPAANVVVVKSEPSSQLVTPLPPGTRHFSGDSSCTSYHYSFADQFCIPSEEAAELEWLSNFVDDSYSDMPTNNHYSSSAMVAAQSAVTVAKSMDPAMAPPGRGARSKRSRAPAAISAAAAAWHSLSTTSPNTTSPSSSSSSSDFPNSSRPSRGGKKLGGAGLDLGVEGGVRRCTHCASEKTPQWRTGPLGPKTLCNACGVRYKSGRLLPEYRPAASPTFVLTQHSNSHRKVIELRRQKELLVLRHRDQSATMAGADAHPSNAARPELLFHGYGVC